MRSSSSIPDCSLLFNLDVSGLIEGQKVLIDIFKLECLKVDLFKYFDLAIPEQMFFIYIHFIDWLVS